MGKVITELVLGSLWKVKSCRCRAVNLHNPSFDACPEGVAINHNDVSNSTVNVLTSTRVNACRAGFTIYDDDIASSACQKGTATIIPFRLIDPFYTASI